MNQEVEAFRIRSEKSKKRGFNDFMADPLVKVLVSTIPPGDNPDALKMLLEASFDKGFLAGQADMMMNMLEHAFKDKKPR